MRSPCIPLLLVLLLGRGANAQIAYRLPMSEADLRELRGERTFGLYESEDHVGWASEAFIASESTFVWEQRQHYRRVVGTRVMTYASLDREVFAARVPFQLLERTSNTRVFVGNEERHATRERERSLYTLRKGPRGWTYAAELHGETSSGPASFPYDYRATDRWGLELWLRSDSSKRRDYWVRVIAAENGFDARVTFRAKQEVRGREKVWVVTGSSAWDGASHELRDEGGRLLRSRLGPVEWRYEPPERAKRISEVSPLSGGYALHGGTIEHAKRARRLRLRLAGEGVERIRGGPGQWVRKLGEGKVEVTIDFANGPKPTPTQTGKWLALRDTAEIPSAHPRVTAVATRVVGEARSDAARAWRLLRYVVENVEYSLEHEAITGLSILDTKRGDCSEFATLYTTLARAVELPCRQVTGLVYDEQRGRFFLHAWVEVAVRGSWRALDPSWDEYPPNATHVRLYDEFSPAVYLGKVRIELAPEDATRPKARSGPGSQIELR